GDQPASAEARADHARGPPALQAHQRPAPAPRLLSGDRRRRGGDRDERRAGAGPPPEAGRHRGPGAGALLRDHSPLGRRPRRRARGGRGRVSDGRLRRARHRRGAALRRLHAARDARAGGVWFRQLGRGGRVGGGRRAGRGGTVARQHGGRAPLRGPPLRLRPHRRGGASDPRHLALPGAGRRALHGDRLRRRAARAAAHGRLHGGGAQGMKARELTVDRIRLHVVEAGEGPALVLLHGLSATHANWEHTIRAFADRWRVVAPDLPGHGRSAKPDGPYTIDFYAGVIRSLGRALGIDEAVVIGNSLGGQIAIELGLAYPAWTRALVLAAPAGRFGAGVQAMRWAIGAAARPAVLRVALPWAFARSVHDPSLPACEERRRILVERLVAEDYPGFARAVTRSLVGSIAAGRQPLAQPTQPTLLVWGRNDRLVSLSGSRRVLRALPHAPRAVPAPGRPP